MRPKNTKVRCTKIKVRKCEDVAKTYDKIQMAYLKQLDSDNGIASIQCNVLLDDLPDGMFTTDFLCLRTDGEYCVRECVFKEKLALPRTAHLLDVSKEYWLRRGIDDWAIVIAAEVMNESK